MKCSISQWSCQWLGLGQVVAVVGLVLLCSRGQVLESSGGWVACPVQVLVEPRQPGRSRRRGGVSDSWEWQLGWGWLRGHFWLAVLRSELLGGLVVLTEGWEWGWVCVLPWLSWLWQGSGLLRPGWGQSGGYELIGWGLNRASSLALVSLGLVELGQQGELSSWGGLGAMGVGLRLGSEAQSGPVEVEHDEAGVYTVRLTGEFELRVNGQIEMHKRLLIIFLGLLESKGQPRQGRRTRDGRCPAVRQEQMTAWFGVVHPVISRWNGYWLAQDWRRLLSQRWGEVLTLEVQQQVLRSWVKFPWWSSERLLAHLQAQGSQLTLTQVKQVAQESGWSLLRQELKRVYHLSPESFRPQDQWLTQQLLGQLHHLTEQLAQVGQLPAQMALEQADLLALSAQLELKPVSPQPPGPWLKRAELFLGGQGAAEPMAQPVRCCYCGTTEVGPKSNQPRLKSYYDEQGRLQSLEVYRWYCHNPGCSHETFTHLPDPLLPHSRFSLSHHLAALQLYEKGRSTYRWSAQQLGVSKMTLYRWVSGFGAEVLPVAALFGLVRCSGVIGVDEKYVKVAQGTQPSGAYNGWMYVYLAVDGYSYDLLHIEIYPANTTHSAQAFLLALRAKGYQPRVVVTDLRPDYHDLIAQVFPQAVHHECIFHALQALHRQIHQIYGPDYAQTHPAVETLPQQIDQIFQAQTKRTAQGRYEQVLAQQETFIAQNSEAEALFACLERHWPRLVNAIGSPLIPTTNNATEQVIRHFCQHYKTFGGFQNIASARLYLGVFEKVYRFSPFSDDAHPAIRGKCPLELAGYDLTQVPFAQLFRGLSRHWPTQALQELVPNA